MRRFTAIEGLRAWLAWTVVACHIVQTADLYHNSAGKWIWLAGTWAVLLFIIISGFVITHLILAKRERYTVFIFRRFMRLWPAFAISCVLGLLVMPLYVAALQRTSWQPDPYYLDLIKSIAREETDNLWAHVVAHATMLHGALSSAILPYSNYTLNGVTWSISLEWQFYLVAPFVVMMAGNRKLLSWLVLAVLMGQVAFQQGWLGQFQNTSFLPSSGVYFLIGIGTRLLFPWLDGKVQAPTAIALAALALVPVISREMVPLSVWVGVIAFMGAQRVELGRIDQFASAIFSKMFESGVALYLGSRSYSTYLMHTIVIFLAHYVLTIICPEADRFHALAFIVAVSVPCVLILSEGMYQVIEKPGIALGSKMKFKSAALPLS